MRSLLETALRSVLSLALLGFVTAPLQAQAQVVNSNEQIPLDTVVFDSCNGFEPVLLTGTLHVVSHTTFDANGGLHTFQRVNAQNVRGVGLITGQQYRSSGLTSSHSNDGPGAGFTVSVRNDFRLIAKGSASNLTLKSRMHTTVNANGEVTSDFSEFSIECQ